MGGVFFCICRVKIGQEKKKKGEGGAEYERN